MNRGITMAIWILIGLLGLGFLLSFVIELFISPTANTPKKQIKRIREIIDLQPTESIVDLGSGTGTFLLSLCTNGQKAVGFEISPIIILISKINIIYHTLIRKQKCNIQIIPENCLTKDWSQFDVVYCNLSPQLVEIVSEQIKNISETTPNKKTRLYVYKTPLPNLEPTKKHKLSEKVTLFEYEV